MYAVSITRLTYNYHFFLKFYDCKNLGQAALFSAPENIRYLFVYMIIGQQIQPTYWENIGRHTDYISRQFKSPRNCRTY